MLLSTELKPFFLVLIEAAFNQRLSAAHSGQRWSRLIKFLRLPTVGECEKNFFLQFTVCTGGQRVRERERKPLVALVEAFNAAAEKSVCVDECGVCGDEVRPSGFTRVWTEQGSDAALVFSNLYRIL